MREHAGDLTLSVLKFPVEHMKRAGSLGGKVKGRCKRRGNSAYYSRLAQLRWGKKK